MGKDKIEGRKEGSGQILKRRREWKAKIAGRNQ